MKNYTQVYVKNSMEAAKTYCEAFGAEITFEIKNDSGLPMSIVYCPLTAKAFWQ